MSRPIWILATAAVMAASCVAEEKTPSIVEDTLQRRDRAKIDVVFVLDTTGSMSGLIEGAKKKVWAIANAIATARETPDIRMGLVAYRDRGDEYVTRLTALTADLDAVYSDLMKFSAAGGGDGPESVNQALAEAVRDFAWTKEERALKLIYLVGDAPPHMDYEQDVHYPTTCKQAATAGIIINTIQCGRDGGARDVWQKIARGAEGAYFAIDQSGGMTAVTTPFDTKLAKLSSDLDGTLIAYGDREVHDGLRTKLRMSRAIAEAADDEALAERAAYKAGAAGLTSLVGGQELVRDLVENKVDLDSLDSQDLPEPMQEMSPEERQEFVSQKRQDRERIQKEIQVLADRRTAFLKEKLKAEGSDKHDSFDRKVLESLQSQAAKQGIVYEVDGEKK